MDKLAIEKQIDMDDESRAKVEGIKNEMKVKEENKMYEELDQLEKYD